MKTDTCISIDSMSGDNGPTVIMEGLLPFAQAQPKARFLLHGDKQVLEPLLKNMPAQIADRCEIRHSDKLVPMHQQPRQALRSGRNSSMWNAIEAVHKNQACAALSAGNTGALMAMAKIILRTVEGLHRPALIASWPTRDGVVAILDVGADITANALQLAEFALLGEAFSQAVHHKKNPKIGILNIGSEDIKGFESLRDAGNLLENSGLNIRYTGFVEANHISMGIADVVVTDGFAGNIAIKAAEGAAHLIADNLREALLSSWRSRLGALLAKPSLRRIKKFMDPNLYNGAVFAGLRGVVVKSHGNANSLGITRALHVAYDMAGHGFSTQIADRLKSLSNSLKEKTKP